MREEHCVHHQDASSNTAGGDLTDNRADIETTRFRLQPPGMVRTVSVTG
jgi:hypothetical protein